MWRLLVYPISKKLIEPKVLKCNREQGNKIIHKFKIRYHVWIEYYNEYMHYAYD